MLFYRSVRVFARSVFRFYFRGQVFGSENFPKSGGGLLVANHASFLDPGLAALPWPRAVHFVARESLFRNPLFSAFIRKLQAIPIRRGQADLAGLGRAISLIRQGEIVLMFPEGQRSHDGTLGRARWGAGLVAVEAHATIYPCYIDGSFNALPRNGRFPKPVKIRVHFGKPIPYERYASLGTGKGAYEEAGQLMMSAIAELKSGSGQAGAASSKRSR